MPQGPVILWHVVLPLPLIKKYLVNPPHVWETWIGIFPNTQCLEAHPAETMFTQAVHLISMPEYPKLRLKFTYNNPEIQAQASAELEAREQEMRRRQEEANRQGQNVFADVFQLTKAMRASSLNERVGEASCGVSTSLSAASGPNMPAASGPHMTGMVAGSAGGVLADITAVGSRGDAATRGAAAFAADHPSLLSLAHGCAGLGDQDVMPTPPRPTLSSKGSGTKVEIDRQQLFSYCKFLNKVGEIIVEKWSSDPNAFPTPPRALDSARFQDGTIDSAILQAHLTQLADCIRALSSRESHGTQQHPSEFDKELSEGLRMALMGLLTDDQSGDATAKIPRTSTNLSASSNDNLVSIQQSFPQLWVAYREVSALAKERSTLLEKVGGMAACGSAPLDVSQRQMDVVKAQQEVSQLRQQLDESRRSQQQLSEELATARAQLTELRSRSS